jgi:type IV pilus assembly protein PilW
MHSRTPAGAARQHGLTLIELMIAMVLGLLLVIAMSAVFVSSSTSRREVQLSADVIENGRYGIDVLGRELAQAGFYGPLITTSGAGSFNDMCSTVVVDASNNDWRHSLQIHAAGLNNNDTSPSCLAGRKAGTDAIFIQRASTCRLGETGCASEAGDQAYIQVSSCGAEYGSNPFVLDVGLAGAFTLKDKDCSTASAEKRRLIRRIYFINASEQLQSMDITPAGAQAPVTLVEGIEQMQIEYAIDGDLDGSADSYNSAPAAADWPNVVGIRLWLLAKSTETSRNAAAAMTFTMGDCVFTSVNGLCNTTPGTPPTTQQLKRRVYSTSIIFTSPKLRRES